MGPEDAPVVVDTNIIFSTLLSVDSRFRAILFTTPQRFLVCETTIIELFELKEKLLALRPNRSEETLVSMLHALLRRVELAREDTITKGDLGRSLRALRRSRSRRRSPGGDRTRGGWTVVDG